MILSKIKNLQKLIDDNDLESIKNHLTTAQKPKSGQKHPRSYLMLSAHNLKHLKKIPQLHSDAIMLNLEDGVAKEQKPMALHLAMLAIQNATAKENIIVRINSLEEGGEDEIKQLCKVKPDAIRVPKIYNTTQVKRALSLIDEDIELHLSIETKEAFDQISALKLSKRVTTFYLGILDLYADLKLSQETIALNNSTVHYILSKFLNDCKIAGVNAVGFTYQKHKDLEGFKKWCELEKLMGYESKSCISPKQVAIANEAFTTQNEIERAKRVVKLFEQNYKRGITGFDDVQLGFIDEPIYKDACNILKQRAIYEK